MRKGVNYVMFKFTYFCLVTVTYNVNNSKANDLSAYDIIHGDLLDFESLFLLTMNDTKTTKTKVKPKVYPNLTFDDLDAMTETIDNKDPIRSYDVNEFNGINKSFNVSRKWLYERWQGWDDPDDYYMSHITEEKKRNMLVKINLSFLMHSRYKIADALKHRNLVRTDKRYKLGYLFSRLRRLHTEQRKLVAAGYRHYEVSAVESLQTLMATYERVVRYDVDIRDTIALIKTVYAEYHKVDQV